MDDRRFDAISRALASGGSRRSMLRILAAGSAALVAGTRAGRARAEGVNVTAAAVAICAVDGGFCNADQECCSGRCAMGSGVCRPCPAPFAVCDRLCTDPEVDALHCGACGNACAEGQVCLGGACCDATLVFVECPTEALCEEAALCCPDEEQEAEIVAFCCDAESTCGDFCCGPDEWCDGEGCLRWEDPCCEDPDTCPEDVTCAEMRTTAYVRVRRPS